MKSFNKGLLIRSLKRHVSSIKNSSWEERKQFGGKREVREREFANYRPSVFKMNAQK